jgi:hypothetical protein
MTYCAVMFDETNKAYWYKCDIEGLQLGDRVIVPVRDTEKEAQFMFYSNKTTTETEPKRSVLRRKGEIVKNIKVVKKRSQEQIAIDAANLYNFLEVNRPTAKTSAEIAEFMGWDNKSTTSMIKSCMKKNPKIINYDYNLYTIRKSDLPKYKMLMEVQ